MRCRIQASGRPQSRWLRSSKIWDPKKRAGQEKGEASNRDLKIVFVGFDPKEFLDLNHPFPIPSATMVQDLIPHLPIWDSPQLQRTLCPGDGFPSCRDFRVFFVKICKILSKRQVAPISALLKFASSDLQWHINLSSAQSECAVIFFTQKGPASNLPAPLPTYLGCLIGKCHVNGNQAT